MKAFIIINLLLFLGFYIGIIEVKKCPDNWQDRAGLSCEAYMDSIKYFDK